MGAGARADTGVGGKWAAPVLPDRSGAIPGLDDMLSRGFVVVATDYVGLGTPGQHPYLIGESEARSVLDSVRAARRFPGAKAGDTFAVWGHSQGGHAALFTGQLAASYAPELKLAGVAAAAPATAAAPAAAATGAAAPADKSAATASPDAAVMRASVVAGAFVVARASTIARAS